jgi:hypothetical protein
VFRRTIAIAACAAALAVSLVASTVPSSEAATSASTATRSKSIHWLGPVTYNGKTYTSLQGAATDGKAVYFSFCHNGTGSNACDAVALVKLADFHDEITSMKCGDKANWQKTCWAIEGKANQLNSSGLGHANDMTVAAGGTELLVTTKDGVDKYFKTNGFGRVGSSSSTLAVDFTKANGKKLSSASRVCYSPKKDRYLVGSGNEGIYAYKLVRNSNNTVTATWDSSYTGIPKGTPAAVSGKSTSWNGMTCDDNYVYTIRLHKTTSGWENHIFVFDWNGKAKGEFILKDANGKVVRDEAEDVFLADGKVFVTFNHASSGGQSKDYFAAFTASWPK